MSKKNITIAGSFIADVVKTTDCYPKSGMMAYITDVKKAVGGCVPNTAISLKKIDSLTPVSVIGKIGTDEHGSFIKDELLRHGIDCSKVKISNTSTTSFCDVMSQPSGERTFFHAKGANAEFGYEDIDINSLDCDIFHIGYIFLLDKFEQKDDLYESVLARTLKEIQDKGIKTSIDVVSDSTGKYKDIIVPVLKYCNFAIMNEVECCMLTDLAPYDDEGNILTDNIRETMEFMVKCGVKDKVVIHCKTAGFCLDVKTGEFTVVPSLDIPKEEIKGSVGAGDAYCAGCLYSFYNGYEDKKALEFASAVAASNLFCENSTDSIINKDCIEEFCSKYKRKKL
ncbi:MAG: carbohydrate kinase family protein [Acutalibacteraceae bacterium]|nr:carbohydrate kinase family protein [Acutalibacteraceae bacterium]